MTTQEFCVICENVPLHSEKLQAFNEKTWTSIRNAADLRREQSHKVTSKLSSCEYDHFEIYSYHSDCFRRYTAVKRQQPSDETSSIESTRDKTTRGIISSSESNTSNRSTDRTCLFCSNVRKRCKSGYENTSECLTLEANNLIKKCAESKHDEKILSLFHCGGDLISKEIKYHKSCYRNYTCKISSEGTSDKSF